METNSFSSINYYLILSIASRNLYTCFPNATYYKFMPHQAFDNNIKPKFWRPVPIELQALLSFGKDNFILLLNSRMCSNLLILERGVVMGLNGCWIYLHDVDITLTCLVFNWSISHIILIFVFILFGCQMPNTSSETQTANI